MYQAELMGRTEKEVEVISQEIDAINKRAGIREKDRAAALGRYLVQIREREANLALETQQARDRELRAADQDVGLLGRPAIADGSQYQLHYEQADTVLSQPPIDTTFESISQESYEDF